MIQGRPCLCEESCGLANTLDANMAARNRSAGSVSYRGRHMQTCVLNSGVQIIASKFISRYSFV